MIWLLALFLLVPIAAEAADINATTCNSSDLNTAFAAAADGDRVLVPAGSCTWTTRPNDPAKSIEIIGSGSASTIITCSTSGGNQCFLWTTKATGNSPAGFSRLSGFGFTGSGCGGNMNVAIDITGISHNVRIDNNRFYPTGSCYGLQIRTDVRGVVDHNIFDQLSAANGRNGGAHVLHVTHDQWNGVSSAVSAGLPCCGDNSWASDSTMGTTDTIIFEDNVFTNFYGSNGQFINEDYRGGSRAVFRFNTFVNAQLGWHGTESNGRPRGHRHQEVYRNKFDINNSTVFSGYPSIGGFRGGTGRLWDNAAVFSGGASLQRMFDGNTYRRDVTFFDAYPWGRCGTYTISSITRSGTTATATITGFTPDTPGYVSTGGAWLEILGVTNEPSWNGVHKVVGGGASSVTFSYTVANSGATSAIGTMSVRSAFDGNTNSTGYPCMDQLGRGKGILITGTEPNGLSADWASPNPNPPQWAGNALDPVYAWNNRCSPNCTAGSNPISFQDNNPSDVTTENIDFYNENISFNGTTGIGRGVRGARPTACTPGTAYWATDGGGNWNTSTTETYSALVGYTSGADGGVDYCDSINHWANDWYVPPTYPHVLVSGGGSPIPATAAITSPVSGSNPAPNSTFAVSGTAAAGSGSLTRIDVYIGVSLACSDLVAPFSPWTCTVTAPSSAGTYALTAKAMDALGQGPASTAVSFTVVSPQPRKKFRLR